MSLADVLATGVAIVNSVTSSLQVGGDGSNGDVWHLAWIGQDEFGKDEFALPVSRPALVEHKTSQRRDFAGNVVATESTLTFTYPVPETAPKPDQYRRQPIDPRDRFVLQDGSHGPIVSIEDFINAKTSAPYLLQVFLGSEGGVVA